MSFNRGGILALVCGACILTCAISGAWCTTLDTYAVKPVSWSMILPDTAVASLPLTGFAGLSVTATPGEYEPASFVVRASSDANGVEFVATDLSDGVHTLPASVVDIRMVKCWYQAEGAGQVVDRLSFTKVMVPELLLKDDKMIDVRTDEVENYMKLTIDGHQTYVCISKKPDVPEPWDPRDTRIYEVSPGIPESAPISAFPVQDSATLQPVDLKAGKNKQVWVTFHVPASAAAGTYHGQINMTLAGSVVQSIAVDLTVLPFTLSEPKTHYDTTKEFTSSMYYRGALDPTGAGSTNDDLKSDAQFRAELRNLIAHGVTKPLIAVPYPTIQYNQTLFTSILSAMRDEGITGPFWTTFDLVLNQTSYYAIQALKTQVAGWTAIAKSYGFTDFYFYGIDEATGSLLLSQRTAWQATHTAGGKLIVAGYKGYTDNGVYYDYFDQVGDLLDISICQGGPDPVYAAKWHGVGHKIWAYAIPQGGIENPAIYRQNYGIYLWKSDYDGASTYCYQVGAGGWNDFCGTMRQLNMTYATMNGAVDTLQWEGYREAIDDIRYATTLTLEISAAQASGDPVKVQLANEAAAYLESIDGTGNLDLVRQRIVEYILGLKFGANTGQAGEGLLGVANAADGGSVTVYNSVTGSLVKTLAGLGSPEWVRFGADGNLYISRYQETTGAGWDIARVSTGTWSPLTDFMAMPNHQAVGIACGLDGYLYAGKVTGVLYKSNTAGAGPTALAGGLGGDARCVAISPEGIAYMCSSGNNWIARYNTRTGAALPNWPVTGAAQSVALGPDATGDGMSDLYVTYWGQPVIDIYNGSTGAKYGVFDTLANYGHSSSTCVSLVFSGDGRIAYFADWNDGIVFRKTGSNPAAPFVAGLQNPRGIALSNEYLTVRKVDVAEAKSLIDRTPVVSQGKIVTAVFGDYFYIEEPDRRSGIRVKKPSHGMQVGYAVSVSGIMTTDSYGERCIDSTLGTVTGSFVGTLSPVFMTNAALGGGGALYDASLPAGQRGISGGVGANNIGLLVKTSGRVVQPIGGGSFYLTDGSGVSVRAVTTGALPQENAQIVVTGIVSCEPDGSELRRRILVTDL